MSTDSTSPLSPPPPASPVADTFERIALSLSGGGFRAAAYSLGTLKALYLLGLLEQVHMLSAASGGTMTGAYYALRRKSGDTFPAIYRDFYELLEQDLLLPRALARWEQGMKASGTRYKLIQAFAETYSQDLYGGARLGVFWQPDDSPQHPFHLQSIIFGATELYSGLTFRFQHGAYLPPPKGNAREAYAIGNGNVSLPTEYARELRIGDVVAASSCFPGGFEPIILPDDFFPTAPAGTPMLTKRNRRTTDRVALLDGGIYDNQGIDSLLLANERNRQHLASVQQHYSAQQAALLQPTTLFLVADVGGAEKDIYSAPPPKASPWWVPRVGQLLVLLVLVLVGLSLSSWRLTTAGSQPFLGGVLAGLAGVGFVGLGLLGWGGTVLYTALRSRGTTLPGLVLPRLATLSVTQLGQLLLLRAGSTLKLLTSVFMRRVRSQNYEQLYRPAGENSPTYQVLSSIIGALATEYERQQAKRKKKKPAGSGPPKVQQQLAAVQETINRARKMGTTLWWQHNKPCLPAIVASAEMTLCYQLLRRYEKQPPQTGTREAEVQRRAQVLWDAYQVGGEGYVVPVSALSVLENPTGTVQEVLACPKLF